MPHKRQQVIENIAELFLQVWILDLARNIKNKTHDVNIINEVESVSIIECWEIALVKGQKIFSIDSTGAMLKMSITWDQK